MDKIQKILEKSVTSNRFSGNDLTSSVINYFNDNNLLSNELLILSNNFSKKSFKYTLAGLIRNCFLIELVNDDISTTIMEVRWIEKESKGKKQEPFNNNDPRFSTFDDCMDLFINLINTLIDRIQSEYEKETKDILELYNQYHLIPYELPIDYKTDNLSGISNSHNKNNIDWFWDNTFERVIQLREFLLNPEHNKMSNTFKLVLNKKIKVKTYLTDRVQTGLHKTDREKRWEVHPNSVHFATRKDSMKIEYTLINQMCHFENFPKEVFDLLVSNSLINDTGNIFRCPITLDPLSFPELKLEIENRTHGMSDFQVGHLNPLKSSISSSISGHISNNISWISSDGNRIQGHLSLDETRALLKRIQENYAKYLIE